MKTRKVLAIITGKILISMSRLLGKQGTALPGRIAGKICPGILHELASNIRNEVIVITGTNGKTTSSNMLARILSEKGCSMVHNKAGANMLSGITTAFIEAADIWGNRVLDYALLETDEANIPLLMKEIESSIVLITNFFSDQLDRYGEVHSTINIIKHALVNKDIELLLNADDPLMAHFQGDTGFHCWYYGFDNTRYDSLISSESREGRYCIFCGDELQYSRFHYAQLGKFRCPSCGNTNPQPNFTGRQLSMTPSISCIINDIAVESPFQGFYNAYNILAAVSLASILGIEDEVIQRALSAYHPHTGRMEHFVVNGKKSVLILFKNPVGLNQIISTMLNDPSLKNVFIALNDNAGDGRDISWIWDCDLELLAAEEAAFARVVCSGQRSGDMAVRIKYTGFNTSRIIIRNDLREGIITAVAGSGEVNYILATYTALFQCQDILEKLKTGVIAGSSKRMYTEA